MNRPSRAFFKAYTQDASGYYELIEENQGQWHYFLFDSPHKPWKIFDTFEVCAQFIVQSGQILQTCSDPDTFDRFCRSVVISQDNIWWNGVQLLPSVRKTMDWPQYLGPNTLIEVDTGKDLIQLVQESDATFAWIPHQDPSYRNLGERLLTIQDALQKIEEMPISIVINEP